MIYKQQQKKRIKKKCSECLFVQEQKQAKIFYKLSYQDQYTCCQCYEKKHEMIKMQETKRNKFNPIIHQIIPNIYLGNEDAAISQEIILKFKINCICVCGYFLMTPFQDKLMTYKKQEQNSEVQQFKIQYKKFLIGDYPEQNIRQYFEQSNQWIQDNLSKGKTILIHCMAGISRSVSFIMAYLIGKKGMSYDEAYDLLKQKKQQINPNKGFIDQLVDYDDQKNNNGSNKLKIKLKQCKKCSITQQFKPRQQFYAILFPNQYTCQSCYNFSYKNMKRCYQNKITFNSEICEIIPNLYLGNQDAAINKQVILKHNINCVSACGYFLMTPFEEKSISYKKQNEDVQQEHKVQYKKFLIGDYPQQNISQYFEQSNQWIEENLSKGKTILIHCMAGISRSASFIMAYLIGKKGMSYQEAFELLKNKKQQINPNRGFLEQLLQYQTQKSSIVKQFQI